MMHRKHCSLPPHFFCHRCRFAFKVAPRWCRSRNSSPKSLLVVVVATERSPHFLPNLVRNSNTLCIFFDMRWCYFENYAISKAHYFFKLGREKNIFVKFVFIKGWKKVNKHRRSWRLWRLVLKIWRLCRGGLQPRFGLSLCLFVLLMKTLKNFLYFKYYW